MKNLLKTIFIFCSLYLTSQCVGQTYIGTRYDGGIDGLGEVFKMTTNGVVTNRTSLTGFAGFTPAGKPVQASNGKLYGITTQGALSGGVLYEYDYNTNVYTVKQRFENPFTVPPSTLPNTQYGSPTTGLLLSSNGKIYGTISNPITYEVFVFSYAPSTGIYTNLDTISNCQNAQGLMQFTNGKLYFYTQEGLAGSGNQDFKLSMFDTLTKNTTHLFTFNNSLDGVQPINKLAAHSNGKLYGVTNGGGVNNNGTIFEFNPIGNIFTKKYDFSPSYFNLLSSFELASNGNFLLTEVNGIYEYNPIANTYTNKISTLESFYGNLTMATPGVYYGIIITEIFNTGLVNNFIYKYTHATNTFVINADLDYLKAGLESYFLFAIGSEPAGLVYANNGKLYGSGLSNIFVEHTPSTSNSVRKFVFNSGLNGANPSSDLVQHCTGKYYGVTSYGGISHDGAIIEYNPTSNAVVKKKDFTKFTTGATPIGAMSFGNNGKLYGITKDGGVNNLGSIYEYNIATNALTNKFSFNNSSKINPMCMIIKDSIIYGVTRYDSIDIDYPTGYGSFFKFNINSNIFTKLADLNFDMNNIFFNTPNRLIDGGNGKLYYATNAQVSDVMYVYDIVTNSYTTVFGNFYEVRTASKPVGDFIYCQSAINISRFNIKTNTFESTIYPNSAGSGITLTNTNSLIGHTSIFNLSSSTTNDFNNFNSSPDFFSSLTLYDPTSGFLGQDITKIILPNQKRNLTNLLIQPNVTYTYRNANWSVATNPTKVAPGLYYIIGTSTSGCLDTVKVTVKVGAKANKKEDEVQQDDIEETNLFLYPNPTTDVLNILVMSKANQEAKFRIFDHLGNAVKEFNHDLRVGENIIQIYLSGLSNGNYFIVLNSSNLKFKVLSFLKR
jgi:uncharacterized repeat protein (TIGR03803 family)